MSFPAEWRVRYKAKTEVEHLDHSLRVFAFFVETNVCKLYVSMNNAHGVNVLQSLQYLNRVFLQQFVVLNWITALYNPQVKRSSKPQRKLGKDSINFVKDIYLIGVLAVIDQWRRSVMPPLGAYSVPEIRAKWVLLTSSSLSSKYVLWLQYSITNSMVEGLSAKWYNCTMFSWCIWEWITHSCLAIAFVVSFNLSLLIIFLTKSCKMEN